MDHIAFFCMACSNTCLTARTCFRVAFSPHHTSHISSSCLSRHNSFSNSTLTYPPTPLFSSRSCIPSTPPRSDLFRPRRQRRHPNERSASDTIGMDAHQRYALIILLSFRVCMNMWLGCRYTKYTCAGSDRRSGRYLGVCEGRGRQGLSVFTPSSSSCSHPRRHTWATR